MVNYEKFLSHFKKPVSIQELLETYTKLANGELILQTPSHIRELFIDETTTSSLLSQLEDLAAKESPSTQDKFRIDEIEQELSDRDDYERKIWKW